MTGAVVSLVARVVARAVVRVRAVAVAVAVVVVVAAMVIIFILRNSPFFIRWLSVVVGDGGGGEFGSEGGSKGEVGGGGGGGGSCGCGCSSCS